MLSLLKYLWIWQTVSLGFSILPGPGHDNETRDYDLNSTPFHILMASGPLNPDRHLYYHSKNRKASKDSVDFTKFNPYLAFS